MTLFSILLVLLIEQFRPLRADNPIYAAIRVFAARIEHSFNAGRPEHGRMAWLALMSVLVVPTLLIYWLLALVGPLAQFIWSVLIVYLTMGFRHYSHYFTAIQVALNNGELTEARHLLAEWTGHDVRDLDFQDVARLSVENALITTHRHV
ncbi:MAG: cobalamin biosynthesis protein, partial [bacterium]